MEMGSTVNFNQCFIEDYVDCIHFVPFVYECKKKSSKIS